MSVLHIQHVSKSFRGLRAVDDVSISLEVGDHLAIVGESGCGKTTLAKMMMGLIRPDAGSIKAQAHSLQMVFQDPYQSLDPLWDVREILKEGLWGGIHSRRDSSPFGLRMTNNKAQVRMTNNEAQERMEQMLTAVGSVSASPLPGRFWPLLRCLF